MRTALHLTLWLTVAALALPAAAKDHNSYDRSVVSLEITYQSWDEGRPWAKNQPRSRHANGVLVSPGLILTTAQMVQDATMVRVEKYGRPPRVAARLVHVDPQINLALLTVDEPGFLDDLEPAKLAPAGITGGTASSVRWAEGQLEVSTSRYSRVDVRESRMGHLKYATTLLTTDVAGGGWAEPVFVGKKLVGITLSQNDKLAGVMPAETIAQYLEVAADPDAYPGFAAWVAAWQDDQDAVQARYLGLDGEPRGVVIRNTPAGSTGHGVLEPRDVLLTLDGHSIAADGTYEHRLYGRLRFENILVDGHFAGDVVPATILRDGAMMDVELALRTYPSEIQLVPWHRWAEPPPYLLAGGLLFRELDAEYLRAFGGDWLNSAPTRLLIYRALEQNAQRPDRRRLVLLAYVVPDPYNLGYHHLGNMVVEEVNGRPVHSIADLARALSEPEGDYHVLHFVPGSGRSELVLDAATLDEATARILTTYGIPSPIRTRAEPLPPLDETGAAD